MFLVAEATSFGSYRARFILLKFLCLFLLVLLNGLASRIEVGRISSDALGFQRFQEYLLSSQIRFLVATVGPLTIFVLRCIGA